MKRDYHIVEMRNIANNRIGGLMFGYFNPQQGTYNAIVPGGKLDLYQSKFLLEMVAIYPERGKI